MGARITKNPTPYRCNRQGLIDSTGGCQAVAGLRQPRQFDAILRAGETWATHQGRSANQRCVLSESASGTRGGIGTT